MANATRFTTAELAELETRIGRAADQALALELAIFDELVAEVMAVAAAVAAAGRALAALDVAAALAELAASQNYVRPLLSEEPAFAIQGGRHPVVEAALQRARAARASSPTIAISARERRLWLLTGPNMAGKSTFLRQNALIAVLAQTGSFVPAEEAVIGIVDRLFSRVGAADDLARGRSTFMVEMVETAAILNQATARSLVILDEIGRGTATFDGLSIAWATLEHLHDVNQCRALFATHFHELGALKERLAALAPYTMRVKEWQNEVVFLHEVAAGAADRSYGIHVAQLAGPARRRRGARRGSAGGAGEGRAVGRGDPARRRSAVVCRRTGAAGGRHGEAPGIRSREGAGRGQSRRALAARSAGVALRPAPAPAMTQVIKEPACQ